MEWVHSMDDAERSRAGGAREGIRHGDRGHGRRSRHALGPAAHDLDGHDIRDTAVMHFHLDYWAYL